MSSSQAISEPDRTRRTDAPGFAQAAPATFDAGELPTRAQVDPHHLTPRSALVLQRMVGNQAVASLLGRNQSVPELPPRAPRRDRDNRPGVRVQRSAMIGATRTPGAGSLIQRTPLRPVVRRSHGVPDIQRDGVFGRFRKSKSKSKDKNTKSLPSEPESEPESAPVQNNAPQAQPFLYVDLVTKTLSRARGSLSLSEAVRGATGHSWLEIQLGPQYADMDAMEADANATEVVDAMDQATRIEIQASPKRMTSVGFYPAVDHFAPINILRQAYKRLPGAAEQPERDHFHGHGTAAMRFAITTPEQASRLFDYIEGQREAGYHFLTHNCTHWALDAIKAAGFTPPKDVKELGLVTSPNKLYRRIYEALELGNSNARVRDMKESDIAKKRTHLSRKDQAKLDAKKKELLAQPDKNRGNSPKLPMRPDNERSTLLPVYFPANTKITVNEGYLVDKEWKSYTINEDMPVNVVLYRGWEQRYGLILGTVQKETHVTAHKMSGPKPKVFEEGHELQMAATTVAFASRKLKSSDVIEPEEDEESTQDESQQGESMQGQPLNYGDSDQNQQTVTVNEDGLAYVVEGGPSDAPQSAPPPKSGSELQIDKGNKNPKRGRFKYNDVLTLESSYEYEELSGKELARVQQQKNHPLHNKVPYGQASAARQKLGALNQNLKDGKISFVTYRKMLEDLDIDPEEVDNYRVTRLTSDDERAQYEVTGGGTQLLYGDPPKPFNTFDPVQKFHSMFLGANTAIYVMDRNGRLYAGGHKAGRFHHSSFLEGSKLAGVAPTEAAGAGEMKVSAGKLVHITNKSGHYRPTPAHMVQVLRELRRRKVPLRNVTLDLFTGAGAAQTYPGGAGRFFKDFTAQQKQPTAPSAKPKKGLSGGYTLSQTQQGNAPQSQQGDKGSSGSYTLSQPQQGSAPQSQGSSNSDWYTLSDQQGAPQNPTKSNSGKPSFYTLNHNQVAPSVPKTGTRGWSYTLNQEGETIPMGNPSPSFYTLNQDAPPVPKTDSRGWSYTLNQKEKEKEEEEEAPTPMDNGSPSFYTLDN